MGSRRRVRCAYRDWNDVTTMERIQERRRRGQVYGRIGSDAEALRDEGQRCEP